MGSHSTSAVTRLAVFLASFGYVGYFPVVPGTAGSAAGLALFALLHWTGVPLLDLAVAVVLCAVGVWSGTIAERHYARDDPGQVVMDEVVGMLVTLLFLPFSWRLAVAGFLVFRVLDVIKPYPASRFDNLAGGLGIMGDDVASAIYANLLLRAVVWTAPGWLR
jgi:phosphatidylglycerophosphatase A